jgi:hypothetical protein
VNFYDLVYTWWQLIAWFVIAFGCALENFDVNNFATFAVWNFK